MDKDTELMRGAWQQEQTSKQTFELGLNPYKYATTKQKMFYPEKSKVQKQKL